MLTIEEGTAYRTNRSPEESRVNVAAISSDTISWPTPDLAKEEERKRIVSDRVVKPEDEKAAPRPHGKEKWVPMPYVPTAVFDTPLPSTKRGGRMARGGRGGSLRGGHSVQSSMGGTGEGKATAPLNGTAGNMLAIDPGSSDLTRFRSGPPISKPKRAASAGPSIQREVQQAVDVESGPGSARVSSFGRQSGDSRRTSTATQTDGPYSSYADSRNEYHRFRKGSQSGTDREGYASFYDHGHPRGPDRRNEGSARTESFQNHGYLSLREQRGEGRSDRGRGGFRGRGGPNFNSTNQQATSYAPSKSQSFPEPGQASQHGSGVPSQSARESRHQRAGSRSQAAIGPSGYGRYPLPLSANGPMPNLPALQTDLANMYNYSSGQPAVMSAMQYHPYMEQFQLLGMVQIQM